MTRKGDNHLEVLRYRGSLRKLTARRTRDVPAEYSTRTEAYGPAFVVDDRPLKLIDGEGTEWLLEVEALEHRGEHFAARVLIYGAREPEVDDGG